MAKLTGDLYYTQLTEIQDFNIIDRRTDLQLTELPQTETLSDNSISFFTEIHQIKDSDRWEVIVHLVNKQNNVNLEKSREYDSFYKILMEQKSSLKNALSELLSAINLKSSNDAIPEEKFNPSSIKNISTDLLSGTWAGEENINKIIIMRSGRGFVIFNNGASMNINIEIENTDNTTSILVTQQSKTNASYFPELPRNIALDAAKDAEPIKWKLSLSDDNTLKGTKYTLILKDNQPEYDSIEVSWNRKITQN